MGVATYAMNRKFEISKKKLTFLRAITFCVNPNFDFSDGQKSQI